MNYNKVMISGNITKDIELRYTPQGTAVCDFSIAINRKYKSGEELKEEVSFIGVTAWSKTAELINKYCSKGSNIFIEGRLTQESWEDKEGKKNSKTKVVAENIQFVNTKKKEEPQGKSPEGTSWLEEGGEDVAP